jgi:hypothetical protein
MTKTYLNIPWAMQSFAATKGAQLAGRCKTPRNRTSRVPSLFDFS